MFFSLSSFSLVQNNRSFITLKYIEKNHFFLFFWIIHFQLGMEPKYFLYNLKMITPLHMTNHSQFFSILLILFQNIWKQLWKSLYTKFSMCPSFSIKLIEVNLTLNTLSKNFKLILYIFSQFILFFDSISLSLFTTVLSFLFFYKRENPSKNPIFRIKYLFFCWVFIFLFQRNYFFILTFILSFQLNNFFIMTFILSFQSNYFLILTFYYLIQSSYIII